MKSFGHSSRISRSECQGAGRLNRIDRLIERVPSTSRRESTFAAMRNETVVTEFGRWLLTEFVNFAYRAVRSFEHSSRVRRSQCRTCGAAEPNRYADRAVPSTSQGASLRSPRCATQHWPRREGISRSLNLTHSRAAQRARATAGTNAPCRGSRSAWMRVDARPSCELRECLSTAPIGRGRETESRRLRRRAGLSPSRHLRARAWQLSQTTCACISRYMHLFVGEALTRRRLVCRTTMAQQQIGVGG